MEEVILIPQRAKTLTSAYREMIGCVAFGPMVRVDGKNIVQRTTKTESGKRTIPLNGRAMEAIRHLKAQRIVGCPFMFATQTGKYLSYRNLLATMEKACVTAGVEHCGLHALRHSFASNLYAWGVEVKIISRQRGNHLQPVHPLL